MTIGKGSYIALEAPRGKTFLSPAPSLSEIGRIFFFPAHWTKPVDNLLHVYVAPYGDGLNRSSIRSTGKKPSGDLSAK